MTLAENLSSENDATAAVLTVLRWLDMEKKPRKRRWNSSTVGRTKIRLAKKLTDSGLPIPNAECLWVQQGGYRGRHWDLARWGADWTDGSGQHWILASWDTMTSCAKTGVSWKRDSAGYIEVFAK